MNDKLMKRILKEDTQLEKRFKDSEFKKKIESVTSSNNSFAKETRCRLAGCNLTNARNCLEEINKYQS